MPCPSQSSRFKHPDYIGLPVKILKALLPSSILTTCPAHLNLLDLITVTILGEMRIFLVAIITFQENLVSYLQIISDILNPLKC